MCVTLLLGGRLGDIFGRRRVLLVGIGGFVAASALCALAPSIPTSDRRAGAPGRDRGDHGPAGLRADPRAVRRRGPAEGVRRVRTGDGTGPIAGPIVGGALVDLDIAGSGWRAIFLVNVPLGLRAIAVGRNYLPRDAAATPDARFDARACCWRSWRRRARLPADPGPPARLAGLVVRDAGQRRRYRGLRAAAPLAAGAQRRWSSRRFCPAGRMSLAWRSCRILRRDRRDGARAERDVPDWPRVQPAGLRCGDGGDPGGGDPRLDHLLDPAAADRPHHDAHRDRTMAVGLVVVDS